VSIASFVLVENCVYGGMVESFFSICIMKISKLNIASPNMVIKSNFEYGMWNIILTNAKKFHWEYRNGKCPNQHQCVQKYL